MSWLLFMQLCLLMLIAAILYKAVDDTKGGKVTETVDGRVEMIFYINGKRYKDTQHNREVIDAYLHTGNVEFLKYLENNSDVTIGGNRG